MEGGFAEIQGFFEEACSFMAEQDDVKTVMVMSHWDVEGSGAAADTSTPGAYDKMKPCRDARSWTPSACSSSLLATSIAT